VLATGDYSEVFVNAFKLVFPNNPPLHCYPHKEACKFHVDRAVKAMVDMQQPGSSILYWTQWPEGKNGVPVAIPYLDPVWKRRVHGMGCMEKWIKEQKLLQHFANAYLDNPNPLYCYTAICGILSWLYMQDAMLVPQNTNQSIKQKNLHSVKGCKSFAAGIVRQTGKKFDINLDSVEQFPTFSLRTLVWIMWVWSCKKGKSKDHG
jgi:hypothetical protein